jgi:hypothetical protein
MNNTKEIWKDIPGFESLYQASNLGEIKSLDRISEYFTNKFGIRHRPLKSKILKPFYTKNKKGEEAYAVVILCKENKKKKYLVHRLIAMTFVNNDKNLKYVNHLNGVKKDNRDLNLEWCSFSENMKHAYSTGLLLKGKGKWGIKPVVMYDFNGVFIKEFESAHEAARQIGVSSGSICSSCRIGHKCKGYIFKYKDGGDPGITKQIFIV